MNLVKRNYLFGGGGRLSSAAPLLLLGPGVLLYLLNVANPLESGEKPPSRRCGPRRAGRPPVPESVLLINPMTNSARSWERCLFC